MRNVLYLDRDAVCVGVYICQYSPNCLHESMYFSVRKVTLLKRKQNRKVKSGIWGLVWHIQTGVPRPDVLCVEPG